MALMFCCATRQFRGTTISTMEKQFNYTTRQMGQIIAFMELTSAAGSIFIPYYVSSKGHFPKWIAFG